MPIVMATVTAVSRARTILREPIFWLVTLAAITYATFSVAQHERFRTNAYDLGIYDQAVWLYSRFEAPWSSILGVSILSDHFGPILALLAPLYWIHAGPETLLVAQAVLAAAAAIPVYLFARRRLGPAVALAAAVAYLGFVGIQHAVAFDFHLATIATFFIAWALYFALTGWWRAYWPAFALALATKEDVPLLFAAAGVYFAFALRPRWIGVATVGASLAYFVLVEFVLMPALPGAPALHHDFALGLPGGTPAEQLAFAFGHPAETLAILLDHPEKRRTMVALPAGFAFLPLLHPLGWLAGGAHLLTRFLATNQAIWELSRQYNANIAPFLAFASVLTLARVATVAARFAPSVARAIPALGAAALVVAVLGCEVAYKPPLYLLSRESFWNDEPSGPDLREMLRLVPPDAIVGAQNQIVPHLSERRTVYIMLTQGDLDYLVFDLDLDPWPFRPEDLEALVDQLLADPSYRLVEQRGPVLVLEHRHDVRPPSRR